MTNISSILWLRQEAFQFIATARVWPDEYVRRRLERLAEECRVLSMEMETSMARAEEMPSTNKSWQASAGIPVTGRY